MTVNDFEATVSLAPADRWDFAEIELLEATIGTVRDRWPALVDEPGALSLETTIPRQVGLSGSSAIIMAALRALARRSKVEWDLVDLARTTLEVETQTLGWTAGPQDRVVQAYTGLIDMDFAQSWDPSRYHRLSTCNLPPLFVAWNQSIGQASTVAHSNVRERWLANEPVVRTAMTRFAELATRGRAALDAGTAPEHWPALMNEAFELRSTIWNITDVDTALIEACHGVGAGVAFAGSGGAVVGCTADPGVLAQAAKAFDAIGAGFLVLHRGNQP